jgi:hypothetical protein
MYPANFATKENAFVLINRVDKLDNAVSQIQIKHKNFKHESTQVGACNTQKTLTHHCKKMKKGKTK